MSLSTLPGALAPLAGTGRKQPGNASGRKDATTSSSPQDFSQLLVQAINDNGQRKNQRGQS